MIKCIAVDDEPLALELLADNIASVPFLELVAQCENALEAMRVMETQKIDLLFLDIQMPGLTGLQFIQSMTQKPMVILITAYEKFALQGFELNVVDYLLKPVPLARFIKACNKARELYELQLKPATAAQNVGYFFVHVEYKMVKIITADVLYIEGLKDYIKINLSTSAKPVITRMPLKTIEDILPTSLFARIHKSYIVSVAAITATKKLAVFVGNIELPVGENYKDLIVQITGKG